MSCKTSIAAAAALSFLAVGTADAASKHKRHKVYRGPAYAYVPAAPYGYAPGPYARTPGPPWAQPWECFTDEGYGRYRACSSGRGR